MESCLSWTISLLEAVHRIDAVNFDFSDLEIKPNIAIQKVSSM